MKQELIMEYHSEFYNKLNDTEQWIRLSDGCYRDCWNCYCPKEIKHYQIPKIERNKIVLLDMNFLYAYPNPLKTIEYLGQIKVNKKVVYYDFQCGLDFTLLDKEIAAALKAGRFGRFNNKRKYANGLRIAWDRGIDEKVEFIKTIHILKEVGYKQIQIFMLVNGKVTFNECVMKLLVLKDLRVEIGDCWYDNQRRGSIKPIYWTKEECILFGKLCRSHNVAIKQKQYDPLDYLYKTEARGKTLTSSLHSENLLKR